MKHRGKEKKAPGQDCKACKGHGCHPCQECAPIKAQYIKRIAVVRRKIEKGTGTKEDRAAMLEDMMTLEWIYSSEECHRPKGALFSAILKTQISLLRALEESLSEYREKNGREAK
jgi:hypothetical protein